MKLPPLLLCALTLMACQSSATDTSQEALRETPPPLETEEPERDTPPSPALVAEPGAIAEPEVVAQTIHLADVDCDEAEDGQGNLIQPQDCVRLTARANTWPARALDPVLHLGQLHFHRYTYGEPGELIFFADRALLPASSPAAIHYGDDPNARFELRNRLEVSR